MATVRKRTWKSKGGIQTAWIADYFDQDGKRHIKTFSTRGAAKDWLPKTQHEIGQGVHVPDSTSQTLLEAADAWITRGEAEGIETSTLRQRKLHKAHILALLDGGTKLSRYSVTRLEAARDELLKAHSRAMARKIIVSLRAILKQAKAVHLASAKLTVKGGGRHKAKLKAGVDFPTAPEVKATIEAAADDAKARAILCLAAFAGLRASELRGLTWSHLDLGSKPKVTVEQRADELGEIGSPKSAAARREIGLNATTVRALKEWKLAQPPVTYREGNEKRQRPHRLVFGTATDRPDMLGNLQRRLINATLAKAGIKHYGFHAFRHFAVSSWLKTCEGDFKAVQVRAGHATLALTLDTYGHLLDKAGEVDQMAAAERLVLG
jgi:integrase